MSERRVAAGQGTAAEALRAALRERGVPCEVEARDRLAVLVTRDAGVARRLADPAERSAVVTLAAEHGFTHVALELDPPAAGASLSRD